MSDAPRAGQCPRLAVVLAAGAGTRLGERTIDVPKCLIPVDGTPIIVNALAQLEAAGVLEARVVVGYREPLIREQLGWSIGRMKVSYCRNPRYRGNGTTCSLWLALDDVRDGALVLEGDVYFERRALDDLLLAPQPDATLVAPWTPAIDGSVVEVAADRTVGAWIQKKDRPEGMQLDGTFKTVNMHRFSAPFVCGPLRRALDNQMAADGGREPIETPLAAIVRGGGRIHAVTATGRWCEIDDEADLQTAEALFERVHRPGRTPGRAATRGTG